MPAPLTGRGNCYARALRPCGRWQHALLAPQRLHAHRGAVARRTTSIPSCARASRSSRRRWPPDPPRWRTRRPLGDDLEVGERVRARRRRHSDRRALDGAAGDARRAGQASGGRTGSAASSICSSRELAVQGGAPGRARDAALRQHGSDRGGELHHRGGDLHRRRAGARAGSDPLDRPADHARPGRGAARGPGRGSLRVDSLLERERALEEAARPVRRPALDADQGPAQPRLPARSGEGRAGPDRHRDLRRQAAAARAASGCRPSSTDLLLLPIYVDFAGDGLFLSMRLARPHCDRAARSGGGARVFVPSIVAPGEPFELSVRSEDRWSNRSSGRDSRLRRAARRQAVAQAPGRRPRSAVDRRRARRRGRESTASRSRRATAR